VLAGVAMLCDMPGLSGLGTVNQSSTQRKADCRAMGRMHKEACRRTRLAKNCRRPRKKGQEIFFISDGTSDSIAMGNQVKGVGQCSAEIPLLTVFSFKSIIQTRP